MDILKETAIEAIKRLPDGCTLEEIMYKLDVFAQVLEEVKDAEIGKLLTPEELLNRIEILTKLKETPNKSNLFKGSFFY